MPRKKLEPEVPQEEILQTTPEEPMLLTEEAPMPDIALTSVLPDDAPEEPLLPYGEEDTESETTVMEAEEAVVLDASEPVSEDLAEPSDPAPKRRTRRKTAAESSEEEPTPKAAESDQKSFYDLDFHTLDQNLSPEQRQEWNTIYASFRSRSAMRGTIIGIDPHSMAVRDPQSGALETKRMYCAVIVPFRVRILIPETELWTEGDERPNFVLRNMAGAQIDFVITHVDREAGFAIGSRKLALRSRRYFFSAQLFHRPGSRVTCHVLAVGPRRCLVECYGHDLNLTQRDMSYAAIPDLRDQYHPGDELNCIVKQYDRQADTLEISVKESVPNPFDDAVFRHPVGSRRQASIAGKYAGGVFCNLPDGAVVMCRYAFHYEDSDFQIGDTVMVVIQRYDEGKKQIFGKIVGKL